MQILEPNVTYVPQGNDTYEHIAKCAKICYASTSISNNDKFCEGLWRNNHRSMFRHVGTYYIIPKSVPLEIHSKTGTYIEYWVGEEYVYVSTNLQFTMEHMKAYEQYRIDWLTATNMPEFINHGLIRYTFIIETGIDITRELNRVSPNAIAEQSTRYVDFNKKIGIVFKRCHWMKDYMNLYKRLLTKFMCKTFEWFYHISRSKYGLDLPPEDARWCLPLDTMSKVAYTYSFNTWERIINLRYFGWTGKPHPDAKIIGEELYSYFVDAGYNIHNYKAKFDNE